MFKDYFQCRTLIFLIFFISISITLFFLFFLGDNLKRAKTFKKQFHKYITDIWDAKGEDEKSATEEINGLLNRT